MKFDYLSPKYTKTEKIKTFYTVVKGATNFCTVSLCVFFNGTVLLEFN